MARLPQPLFTKQQTMGKKSVVMRASKGSAKQCTWTSELVAQHVGGTQVVAAMGGAVGQRVWGKDLEAWRFIKLSKWLMGS